MDILLSDLFSPERFDFMTLTAQLNNVPFVPSLLGAMGLYAVDGVSTTDIAIEERNGTLSVIQTSEWGAPLPQLTAPKRNLRKAPVSHFGKEATIGVGEVQNALSQSALSGQPQLETIEGLVADRMDGPFGLRAQTELTHEHHRLGGISGVVLDADGTSELYNWFDFFGISPLADAEIDFDAMTADDAFFELQCTAIIRAALRECEDLPVTAARPVALCGDNFYDRVYSNKEVVAWRKTAGTGLGAAWLPGGQAFRSIDYGGISWVNYRGMKSGAVGVDANEARFFLHGVPGLFQMLFGPPDILGKTNMKGLPIFGFMPPSRQTERMAVIEAQSNPLTFCSRPRSLRTLTIAP